MIDLDKCSYLNWIFVKLIVYWYKWVIIQSGNEMIEHFLYFYLRIAFNLHHNIYLNGIRHINNEQISNRVKKLIKYE